MVWSRLSRSTDLTRNYGAAPGLSCRLQLHDTWTPRDAVSGTARKSDPKLSVWHTVSQVAYRSPHAIRDLIWPVSYDRTPIPNTEDTRVGVSGMICTSGWAKIPWWIFFRNMVDQNKSWLRSCRPVKLRSPKKKKFRRYTHISWRPVSKCAFKEGIIWDTISSRHSKLTHQRCACNENLLYLFVSYGKRIGYDTCVVQLWVRALSCTWLHYATLGHTYAAQFVQFRLYSARGYCLLSPLW